MLSLTFPLNPWAGAPASPHRPPGPWGVALFVSTCLCLSADVCAVWTLLPSIGLWLCTDLQVIKRTTCLVTSVSFTGQDGPLGTCWNELRTCCASLTDGTDFWGSLCSKSKNKSAKFSRQWWTTFKNFLKRPWWTRETLTVNLCPSYRKWHLRYG